MSFIFENKKLIQTLVEVGDEAIQKQAQNARTNAALVSDYELAQKLLFKLQRELGDPQAPAAGMPLGVEGGAATTNLTANTADFRTLGDFLNWAAQKKLTWKGKRFAWNQLEVDTNRNQSEDPTEKAWVFTSMSFDRNDRSVDRQPKTVSAYADKDVLVEFLSALRDSQEARNNKVLSFMLSSLIGEVNRYLRSAGQKTIDPKPSAKPQDSLNSDLIVDFVPDILDLEKPYERLDKRPFQNISPNSDNALTVEDLKDESTFKAWLRDKKVKVTIPSQGNQSTKVVGVADPEGDPCLAVHILYRRALYLNSFAAAYDKGAPNYSKAVALYLQSVINFGKTFFDKDGKPCSVVSPGSDSSQQPGQQSGQQSGQQPGQQSGKDLSQFKEHLDNIVRAMPLRLEGLSIDRIQRFFQTYESFLQGANSTEAQTISGAARAVMNYITSINTMLKIPKTFFPLPDARADDVVTWLHNPAQQYIVFLTALRKILIITKDAISDFYARYALPSNAGDTKSSLNSQQLDIIRYQVIGPSSIYQDNLRWINQLLDQSSRVVEFINDNKRRN